MHLEPLDDEPSPHAELQRDWQMFERVESGRDTWLFRTWASRHPVVVVGRHTPVKEHVHLDACRADGVPLLIRCSGGGAVVLGPGCLNYAIALPLVSHPGLTDVAQSFGIILGWLAAALNVEGLSLEGGTDLALASRKVSGNAQRRGRCALLHHGTLLHDFDPRLASTYLREPSRQPSYRNRRLHEAFLGNLPLGAGALRRRLGRLTELAGITIASAGVMAEEPTRPERGAQEVTPGEREAKKQAERRQDLREPADGRDVPPADEVKKGHRSPRSPWMGGG